MTKATTKYEIFATDAEGVVTGLGIKSKKATAVDVARAHRQETGEGVVVKTQNGTEVFALDAKKTIKMSPRYTRVVDLPEGVEVPEGFVARYVRPRRGLAVLHEVGAAKDAQYALLVLATNELLEDRFPTTRDAGARMREGVVLPAPVTVD